MSNVIRLKTEPVTVAVEQNKVPLSAHAQIMHARVTLARWSDAARAISLLQVSITNYRKAAELLPENHEKRVLQKELDDLELLFIGLVGQLIEAAERTARRTKTILASLEEPLQVMPKD